MSTGSPCVLNRESGRDSCDQGELYSSSESLWNCPRSDSGIHNSRSNGLHRKTGDMSKLFVSL